MSIGCTDLFANEFASHKDAYAPLIYRAGPWIHAPRPVLCAVSGTLMGGLIVLRALSFWTSDTTWSSGRGLLIK